ncbi:hypothetical protein AB205_0217630 [Aquarana catesbeiana]|uniref:Uncharacterized protein n=1 Tax=Aquarana catesbeiana TaxID=8400 RepID=A0A2G9QE41_AQUCT|nr:hypothetical protein AB205_0217630 [Aquarana catesbeiana]
MLRSPPRPTRGGLVFIHKSGRLSSAQSDQILFGGWEVLVPLLEHSTVCS